MTIREGVRLTRPQRALLDAAEAGSAPDQIERGIQTAIRRGWVTPAQLHAHAQQRHACVAELVAATLDRVAVVEEPSS